MKFVSVLRGLIAVAVLAISALYATGASADTFTWVMKNSHPRILEVRFYSQDRNVVWPGGSKVYKMTDRATKNYRISCTTGEYICYGAWISGNPNATYWGVGNGDKGCNGCCYECNGGKSRLFNFTE
jgi:hypothetical protein